MFDIYAINRAREEMLNAIQAREDAAHSLEEAADKAQRAVEAFENAIREDERAKPKPKKFICPTWSAGMPTGYHLGHHEPECKEVD